MNITKLTSQASPMDWVDQPEEDLLLLDEGALEPQKATDTSAQESSRWMGTAAKGLLIASGITMAIGLYYYYATGAKMEEETPCLPPHPDLCCDPEYTSLCAENLGIPRNSMPQFANETYINQFLSYLGERGVSHVSETASAPSFFATQCNLLRGKVLGMVSSFNAGTFNPCGNKGGMVLASSDDYILDGHHRWAACSELQGRLSIVHIDAPIRAVLEYAKAFGAPQATTGITDSCCQL